MTTLTLLAESALRSLALGAAVWIVLRVARVRNAQAQMTAWTIVLLAAVLMPALMRWPTVPIPAPRTPLVRLRPAAPALAFVMEPVRAAPPRTPVNWLGVLGSCYLAGSILLLLRLAAGPGRVAYFGRCAANRRDRRASHLRIHHSASL